MLWMGARGKEVRRVLIVAEINCPEGHNQDTPYETQSNLLPLQREDRQRENARSILGEIAREGAQKMLQSAVEAEVAAYIEAHQHVRDGEGHRLRAGLA